MTVEELKDVIVYLQGKIEKDLCDFFDISYDSREYEEEELG